MGKWLKHQTFGFQEQSRTAGCSQFAALISFLTQAREKYEKALEELSFCTSPYRESMEHAFEQCQNFEERRLEFFKEALLDVKRHLNLIENQRYENDVAVSHGRQLAWPWR